ncbi:BamA/TamA family outer membrane protein [Vibrio sp. FNV 38]|nr:BamA/TamA family outer membrane protein [Vibrio sp. FNV 38]
MNKTLCRALTSISIISTFSVLATSFTDPIDGMFDMGEYLAENAYGFLPIPIVITEPAVGFGGGMFGLFLHENEQEKEQRQQQALQSIDGGAQLIPPAVSVFGGAATENGTWFAAFGHRRTWNQDSIRYMGGLGYGNAFVDVSTPFNDVLLPSKFESDTKGMGGIQHLQFRIENTDLFLGLSQTYTRSEVRASDPRISKLLEAVFGDSSTSSGLGFTLEYDTTNSFFFPTSGISVETEYMWYREGLGGDFNYDTLAFSLTSYHALSPRFTLIGHASFDALESKEHDSSSLSSSLPPLTQPYIDMRGIAAYAYQNDIASTLQTQLMWHVDPRWTVLGFGGIGSVAKEASELYSDKQWAYGLGFRYQIARRYGIHTGMDFAFSDDEKAFYFNVGSGF